MGNGRAMRRPPSPYHFIGAQQGRLRNGDAERLGCLEVDYQFRTSQFARSANRLVSPVLLKNAIRSLLTWLLDGDQAMAS
jgi:hypothetical protein